MRAARSTFIYFFKPVGLDGPIKIGCSDAPVGRLATFAAWSPFPLKLIGYVPGEYNDEQFLHGCFAAQHSHGEWFHYSPALGDAIQKAIAAGSVSVLRETLTPVGSIRRRQRRAQSAERKLCLSYRARIVWAEKRLRLKGEDFPWHAPEDVVSIADKWRARAGFELPSDADIARLNEYLANPQPHSVVPSWRRLRLVEQERQAS